MLPTYLRIQYILLCNKQSSAVNPILLRKTKELNLIWVYDIPILKLNTYISTVMIIQNIYYKTGKNNNVQT